MQVVKTITVCKLYIAFVSTMYWLKPRMKQYLCVSYLIGNLQAQSSSHFLTHINLWYWPWQFIYNTHNWSTLLTSKYCRKCNFLYLSFVNTCLRYESLLTLNTKSIETAKFRAFIIYIYINVSNYMYQQFSQVSFLRIVAFAFWRVPTNTTKRWRNNATCD